MRWEQYSDEKEWQSAQRWGGVKEGAGEEQDQDKKEEVVEQEDGDKMEELNVHMENKNRGEKC